MKPSDFLKIHDSALVDTLEPDMTYHYRSICRWYSEKFHTPLHTVENELPPIYVLRHYYESNFSTMEEEDMERLIFKALNPDWNEDEEEDIQDFIDMVEKEDKARQSKSTNKKQSIEGKSKPSGTSSVGSVTRTFDEPPPPEAGSDPDSTLGPTPVIGDEDDDSDPQQD
jgi:hypothetical protein